MKVILTGACGFIGSHLAERLLAEGHTVIGIDSYTNYYDKEIKKSNISIALQHANFTLIEDDILNLRQGTFPVGDVCIHLASQPGVRDSWGHFDTYTRQNLVATQHLAHLLVEQGVSRIVFASSSSVYGDQRNYPCKESDVLLPRSPYGVTKLAGESLLRAYSSNFGLEVLALRFFTVYGPRQRPDMATHRLISAALNGDQFTLFGDGTARRDFTYVTDVVDACVRSLEARVEDKFTPVNIGGSGETSMTMLVELIEEISGKAIDLIRTGRQLGDVDRTGADYRTAQRLLGWRPVTSIQEGLSRHIAHMERTQAKGRTHSGRE